MEARGTLKVLLQRGAGLKAADLNGKSDPYVVVKCGGGKEQMSKVIYKTLDPEWNESFDFGGTLSKFLETGLLLKVYDKDRITRDDSLGVVADCHACVQPNATKPSS